MNKTPIKKSTASRRWAATQGTALLRLLPAEAAHRLGITCIKNLTHSHMGAALNLWPTREDFIDILGAEGIASLQTTVPTLGSLRHPIGLAAGFDKNAEAVKGFAQLGFSLMELGTVTPRPQAGNVKPRMFRIPDERALINRMGFNSAGIVDFCARLQELQPRPWKNSHGPLFLGINAGKNKETPDDRAAGDFIQVLDRGAALGDYFVINISSPNTPGLRALATPSFIETLSNELPKLRHKTWIKLDPDLSKSTFQNLIEAVAKHGFAGIVLTNTKRVESPQTGGLSGHPLIVPSTTCLEWAWEVHRGSMPMIASGGVFSGRDAFQKIIRGAAIVQIYSALVYRGPWVVLNILRELLDELKFYNIASVGDALGIFHSQTVNKP